MGVLLTEGPEGEIFEAMELLYLDEYWSYVFPKPAEQYSKGDTPLLYRLYFKFFFRATDVTESVLSFTENQGSDIATTKAEH